MPRSGFCLVLSSPWAVVDQKLLDRAAQVLKLSGEQVVIDVGRDALHFGKYGDEWCITAHRRYDQFPSLGGVVDCGSCMSSKVVEQLLRKLLDGIGPQQLTLF